MCSILVKPANTVDLRQNNRNRIFRFIYEAEAPVSKQDVARALSLSLPTVSCNLTEMMQEGLLAYDGTKASTGGRKPRSISVVSNARFAAGISLTDNNARIIAIDLGLSELAFEEVDCTFEDSESYYSDIAAHFEQFLDRHALAREKLLGVGVTIPGVVQPETDFVEFAPTLNKKNVTLSGIKDALPYPAILINDASASGFAEWRHHGKRSNMAYLSIERGVGGAVLTNGSNYSGDHFRSGEFGHMCIVPGGTQCRCGCYGCLEAYCSTSVISDRLGMTLEEFFNRLDAGSERLSGIWSDYVLHLAQGISSIHAALDCDIILGGQLAFFINKKLFLQIQEILSRMDPFGSNGSYLRLGRFASKSACIGAAMHYISNFVDNF